MTVHITQFSRIGNANIVNNSNTDGLGSIQAAKGIVASESLASTESSAAGFADNTRLIRVAADVDSYIAIGDVSADATIDPRIFMGAGTFDYFAVDPGQYVNVVDA